MLLYWTMSPWTWPLTQQIPLLPGESASTSEVVLTAMEFYNRGLAQAILKRYVEAIAEYDEALLVDSNNAAVYGHLGVARIFLGELRFGL